MSRTDSKHPSLPKNRLQHETSANSQQEIFTGPIYRVGDRISSDDILSPLYLSFDLDQPDERRILADYAFQNIESDFGQFKQPGDSSSPYRIILAGHQFGHGSARRHAPVALKEAGIIAILALSYANGFYRTCVNEGGILPLILQDNPDNPEWPETGSIITINIDQNIAIFSDHAHWSIEPPGVTLDIYRQGGLLACCDQATSQ